MLLSLAKQNKNKLSLKHTLLKFYIIFYIQAWLTKIKSCTSTDHRDHV